MYDEAHITHDAATVEFDTDADGIRETEDGGTEFVWDDVRTSRIDDPPHANAFDTEEFYVLPATVARPIPQPYQYGEDAVWLKKPREELKKAAWSLDNAPWTMGHPDTGMVKDADDVRGFWSNPRYVDSRDDLNADLHVPVGDEEAMGFIEENDDVSVGFYNRVARTDEYDGVVGGGDDDGVDVDGYQTDMLFDHCASVRVGRCPGSEGCGIDGASSDLGAHGHMSDGNNDGAFLSGTAITGSSDADEGHDDASDSLDGGRHNGRYFAISPDENSDDEWKFPVNNCDDVQDAWSLRNHGDVSVSVEDLESRIRRRARELDCSVPGEDEDSLSELQDAIDRYEISPDMGNQTDGGSCTDCGDNDNESSTMDINFDDLSAEAALSKVAEQHDGVADHLEELQDKAEKYEDVSKTAEEAAEELDASPDNLPEAVGTLKDTRDSLRSRVDELEEPKKEDHVEYITERTDRFGDEEDLMEEGLDQLEEYRELVEDLTSEEPADEVTANADGGDGEGEPSFDPAPGEYAKTPW